MIRHTPLALSLCPRVDLGVYCRRVSTVDEMPDPGLMKTWWVGRSRQGLGRAGRVYRNSCQGRQSVIQQTPLALSLCPRVDLGVYCRRVSTIDEMPDPGPA